MAFAALTIDLNAKVANLETGLKRTENQLKSLDSRAQAAGKAVTQAFAFVGVGALVGVFSQKIIGLVDEMAKLDDAAEITGSSVESISEAFNKVRIGGASLEQLTTIAGRLTKTMQGADDETKGAGEAFDKLGIQTRDATGNLRPSIDVLTDLSKKLFEYEDSTNKSAYAQAILGKQGEKFLPILKDLATETGSAVKVTAEQAAAAEELQKSIARLSVSADLAKQSFISDLIPSIQKVIDKFNEGSKAGLSFMESIGLAIGLSTSSANAELEKVRKSLEVQRKTLSELEAMGSFTRSVNETIFGDESQLRAGITLNVKREKYLQALVKVQDRERSLVEGMDGAGTAKPGKKPDLPPLRGVGNKPDKESDPAKAIEALAKERTRIFLDEQKRIAAESLYILDNSNTMGLESIESYFDRRKDIAEGAYYAERIALNKLIEAQQQSVNRGQGDPKKLAESTKELEITQAKRNALEAEFKLSGVKELNDKGKATREYAEQIAALNVQLETIKGNSVSGALASFDKQFEKTVSEASKTNDRATLDSVAALRKFTEATAEYNDLGAKRAVIEEQLATATARNQSLLTTGAITELEAMKRLGEIRRDAVPDLERIADAQKKIAEAIGNPKLLADADAFKARTEELAKTADVLREKYLSIGEGAFSGVIDDLASGSKTAIDIAKDMVAKILLELVKLEFAGLGRKGAASLLNLITGVGGSGDVPFEFSGSGFALGGDPPLGKASLVGERGPELFIPNSAGTVVPNHKLGGGSPIIQNFDMRGSADSENLVRRAAALGAASARASIFDDRVRGGKAFA